MKITKLSFNHIHSLTTPNDAGFQIDFENRVFVEEGLFAIVGQNGAGKSTILEAISYALFRKSARYDRNTNLYHTIITKGQKKAFIELEFICRDKLWRMRLDLKITNKRSGEDGDYKEDIILTEVDGENKIIAEKKNEVDKFLKENLKINYEQFSRSIMLAQGAFDSFLKANPNEKAELLSQITGGEIYKEISKRVFERHKTEDTLLTNLKLQLEMYRFLTDEEKVAFQTAITNATSEIETLRNNQTIFEGQKKYLEELNALVEKYNISKQKKEATENKRIQYEPQFKALATHQKLEPYWGQYLADKELQKQIQEQQNIQSQQTISLQVVTKQLENTTQQKIEATSKLQKVRETNETETIKVNQAALFEANIKTIEAQLVEVREQYKILDTEQKNTQQLLNNENQNLIQITQKFNTAQSYLQNHQSHKDLSGLKNVLIQNAKEYFGELNKLQILSASVTEKNTEKTKLSKILEKLTTKKSESEAQKSKITQEITFISEKQIQIFDTQEVYLHQVERYNTQLSLFNTSIRLEEFANRNHSEQASLHTANENLGNLKIKITALQTKLQDGLTHLEAKKSTLTDKELIKQQQDLIKSYEDRRNELVENTPCPLCGATHHPYSSDVPPLSTNDLDQNIQQLKSEIKTLEDEILRFKTEITRNETTQKSTESEILKSQEAIANLSNQFNTLTQEIKQELLDKNEQFVFGIGDWKEIKEWLSTLKEQLSLLSTKLKNYKSDDTTRTDLQSKFVISEKEIATAVLEITKTEAELNIINTFIEEANQKIQQNKIQTENLKTQLEVYVAQFEINFPNPQNLASWEVELNNLVEKFNQSIEEKEALANRLSNCNIELSRLNQILSTQNEKLNECTGLGKKLKTDKEELEAQKETLIGKQSVDEARQKLKSDLFSAEERLVKVSEEHNALELTVTQAHTQLEGTKKRLEQEIEQWTIKNTQLLSTLQTYGIQNLEEYVSNRLQGDKAKELEQLQTHLNEETIQIQALYTQAQQNVETQKEKCPANITETTTLAEVNETLANSKITIEEKQIAIQSSTFSLEADERKKIESTHTREQIEQQNKVVQKWERLNKLIGSNNGDKFNKFAQSITLKVLTELSNIHLDILSKRYLLSMKEEEDDSLSLLITDTFQGDTKRSIESLSGGEKFLVSLAMALGLSDLSSGNQKIETLFIDEGFGALDAENLDLAYTALDRLQATGRTIGIITHVESMIERIHAKIKVERVSDGFSTLKLPY